MLYAVIPAGGSGTRLWPLSRAGHPKFLHALTGSQASMLQATVTRLAPLSKPDMTYVVTGVAHATAVARQLPDLPDDNIVVEPSARDSCPAIALASAIIARRDPTAVMGSFAADHLIANQERFLDAVRTAIEGAAAGYMMTIGIAPTHAETGYGYVQVGDPVGPDGVLSVREFKEKPDAELARRYLASGEYLWNASMFVWRVDIFLSELERQSPEIYAGVSAIAEAWNRPERDAVVEREWPRLPKVPVDTAVMEGAAAAGKVATVRGAFGWNDVGDFHTLGELLRSDADGNVVLDTPFGASPDAADVLIRDSSNVVVVPAAGRIVTAVGVRDLVIVDTQDALLVCARERAQDIKRVVDELRERGHAEHI
ncbi:MAG: mannose-1-phosphate guanylyltransferase [Dactylosporangium sp.]|nr:mannose-1-phosphate guanylyltransferase [Dactylosporangium sp.]NNJ61904.1 mannose-1-phosphate guanylyltransferase [Dactylosporangium sp.]